MRVVHYNIPMDEDGFLIASFNEDVLGEAGDTAKTCLPIKMTIGFCSGSDKGANILQAAYPTDASEADFIRDYAEILLGKTQDWRLVEVTVDEPGEIGLYYYRVGMEEIGGCIYLDIRNTPITSIDLTFLVPHRDGRPDTKYVVYVYCYETATDHHFVRIREYLSPCQCNKFELRSDNPNVMFVTEYVDL